MPEKLLKEIIVTMAGKPAEAIIDLLSGKKYVNEFIIAKKLDLTINQTRNILYKISDHGLVSFIRKKDKRKGWYTYFWKIERVKCLEFLKSSLLKKIDQVNHQIKSRETKEFYSCERCHIEFTEENALVHNFTCLECGNLLSRKDNSSVIREYNRELDRLKRDLSLVDGELNREKEKMEKDKLKAMRKEEKLKKEARKKTVKKKVKITKKIKASPKKSPKKKAKKKITKPKKKR